MKKIVTLFAAVVLAASTSAFAQNMDFGGGFFGEGPQFEMNEANSESEGEYDELSEVTSAKDYAQEHTDMLANNMTLTDDQYQKVYKIYKTEAQTYINASAMGSSSSDMMMGPMEGNSQKASSSNSKEKRVEKRNKKMADVLSSEQFNIYLRIESR